MQLALRIVLLVLILNISCISKRNVSQRNKSDEIQIVKGTIKEKILDDFFIYNEIDNESLLDFLNEYMQFDELGYYHEFGPLRQWMSDPILDSLFTKDQVQNIILKLKLQKPEKWTETDIKYDSSKFISKDDLLSNDVKTLSISCPILFKNNRYALIRYNTKSGFFDEHGSAQTLLFHKKNGFWAIIQNSPF